MEQQDDKVHGVSVDSEDRETQPMVPITEEIRHTQIETLQMTV